MNAKLLLSLTRSCLHLQATVSHEVFEEGSKLGFDLLVDLSFLADSGWNMRNLASNGLQVHLFEFGDLRCLEFVEESTDTGEKHDSLVLNSHWNVLLLLEELSEFLSSVKELLGGGIKI